MAEALGLSDPALSERSQAVSLLFIMLVPCPLIICPAGSGSVGRSSSRPASYAVVRSTSWYGSCSSPSISSLLRRMWYDDWERADDFKRYGYFYALLYCTALGFQANIVKEQVLLSASLHIFAGLKRTRDQKLSSGLKSGQLNLASLLHRRGTSAVECVTAHLRGFEDD